MTIQTLEDLERTWGGCSLRSMQTCRNTWEDWRKNYTYLIDVCIKSTKIELDRWIKGKCIVTGNERYAAPIILAPPQSSGKSEMDRRGPYLAFLACLMTARLTLNQENSETVKPDFVMIAKETRNELCKHPDAITIIDKPGMAPVFVQLVDLAGWMSGIGVRPAIGRPQKVMTLLIEKNFEKDGRGIVADLALECVASDTQELFPAIDHLFLERANDFVDAERNAAEWCSNQNGLWPPGVSVRWKLQRRDRQPLLRVDGNSLGGAFALGMSKLLAMAACA